MRPQLAFRPIGRGMAPPPASDTEDIVRHLCAACGDGGVRVLERFGSIPFCVECIERAGPAGDGPLGDYVDLGGEG